MSLRKKATDLPSALIAISVLEEEVSDLEKEVRAQKDRIDMLEKHIKVLYHNSVQNQKRQIDAMSNLGSNISNVRTQLRKIPKG
jgi:predicted  nucleic acid-binding Zn-ribbon protein